MVPRPPPIVLALLACNVMVVLAFLLNIFIGKPSWRITIFVDLNGEANLVAWYSSVLWLLCAAAFAVFAWRNVRWNVWRSWSLWLVPSLFVLLSLDETAQIHEHLGRVVDALLLESGHRHGTMFDKTGIWMFGIGIPFVAFCLLLYFCIRPYLVGARVPVRLVVTGMVVMLSGALGVETLSNFVVPDTPLAYAQAVVEELLEMVGATVVFWGAIELLSIYRFRVELEAVTLPAGEPEVRGKAGSIA